MAENKIDLRIDERDDVVVQAAKIIAPEWFTGPWIDTATGEEPESCKTRRKYEQSKAYHTAWQVLQFAATIPDLAALLVDVEVEDWKRMGIDAPEVRGVVEKKHKKCV